MSDHIESVLAQAQELGLPLQIRSAPRSRPKPRGASEEERERIRRMTVIRERAQTSGWPGPFRVQVFRDKATISIAQYTETSLANTTLDGVWLDLPTTHDRLGTALARCRALVHGLPNGVRPGWYGDRLSTLGTHETARVIDGQERVVHEEARP